MSGRSGSRLSDRAQELDDEEALRLGRQILAQRRQTGKGKMANLAKAVAEPEASMETFTKTTRNRNGDKVVDEVDAVIIENGRLKLWNVEKSRYVYADQQVGRELRKGPNNDIYKAGAAFLGRELKDVRPHSAPGTSSRTTEAAKGIIIANPKESSRAAELQYGNKEFEQLYRDPAYSQAIIDAVNEVAPDVASALQAAFDSGNLGKFVKVKEDGRERRIVLGANAYLNLAAENPSAARKVARQEAWTSEEYPKKDAKEASRSRQEERKALSDITVTSPEGQKRQIKWGGVTHVGLAAAEPGYASAFEKEFRTKAAAAGLTKAQIDDYVVRARERVAAHKQRSRSGSSSRGSRSRSPSPAPRATSSRTAAPARAAPARARTPSPRSATPVEEEEEATEVGGPLSSRSPSSAEATPVASARKSIRTPAPASAASRGRVLRRAPASASSEE
jgi:hypothetical protein